MKAGFCPIVKKFVNCPVYTVSIVMEVHQHNSLPLGQIRAFSPVSCRAHHKKDNILMHDLMNRYKAVLNLVIFASDKSVLGRYCVVPIYLKFNSSSIRASNTCQL